MFRSAMKQFLAIVLCLCLLCNLMPAALAEDFAITRQPVSVTVDVDKTATFTVRLLERKNLTGSERAFAVLDNFGTTVFTNMPLDVSATGGVFKFSGTLREPGFLRLTLPPTKKGRNDPFVFSAGFEPEKIQIKCVVHKENK